MKAVIIDNEYPALNELKYYLKLNDVKVAGAFTSPLEGYDFIINEPPDILFLDIDMPQMSGLDFGVKIQGFLPSVFIVFVTAYPQYSQESFKAHPVDYILKPIEADRFSNTIDYIRRKLKVPEPDKTAELRIKCFGRFEVYANGDLVEFKIQKTRELLAYLICHIEKTIYKDELVETLFGPANEKNNSTYYRVTLYRLRNLLAEMGIKKEQLLIKNDCSLDIADGVCDYVDLMRFINNHPVLDKNNIFKALKIVDSVNGDLYANIDAPWVSEFRETIIIKTEELMIKIAAFYMEADKAKETEIFLLKLIDLNPLSEPGNLALLDLYIKTENVGKYKYHYRRYANTMKEEFGGIPEKKYQEYYENILRF